MARYGLLLFWLCTSLAQAFYEPQLSVSYRYGRYRQLGRIQLLYPIKQSTEHLLYSHIIGLLDSQDAHEGNVGFGYRLLKDKVIVGGYGFYDLRKTIHQNRMQQMTLGLEYLTLSDELRSNVYIPFSVAKPTGRPLILNAHSIQNAIVNQQEIPLSGFDVEWDHSPSFSPSMQFAAGYYYFAAKSAKPIQGPRFRLEYQVTDCLGVEVEGSYDKARRFNYFIGARFALTLGPKQVFMDPLMRKMIQMPIRDIDVIVQAYSWDRVHREPAFVISTPAELQSMGSGKDGMTLEANYVLSTDIDLRGFRTIVHPDGSRGFKPIGTKKHPFTGRFFGQEHTITGLFIEDKRKEQYLGLFGYIRGTKEKPALIEKVHLTGSEIMSGEATRTGGLVGFVEQAIIRNASSQGYFRSEPRNAYIGGLIGIAHNSYLTKVHSAFKIKVLSSKEEDEIILGGLIGSLMDVHLTRSYSQGSIGGIINNGRAVGGLVGEAYSSSSYGKIDRIRLFNYLWEVYSVSDIQGMRGGTVGGLIGNMDATRLERAYSQGYIKASKSKPITTIGGLVGKVEWSSYLYNVYSMTDLQAENSCYVGGLIGAISAKVRIEQAYSMGSIYVGMQVKTVHFSIVGGLIGDCVTHGSILSCLSDVYSRSQIHIGPYSRAGGLFGKMKSIVVRRACFAGALDGPEEYMHPIVKTLYSDRENSLRDTYVFLKAPPTPELQRLLASSELVEVIPNSIFAAQFTIKEREDALITIPTVNPLPSWLNSGIWLTSSEGPVLIPWTKEQDILDLLGYANSLGCFKAPLGHLPLELETLIFLHMQSYHALNIAQIMRLLHYAFSAIDAKIEKKARRLWTRQAFLAYVLGL